MSRLNRPIRVVVVEDDPDDRLLAHDVLEQLPFVENITLLDGGGALLEYLRARDGSGADLMTALPDLIFLDINMPGQSGLELLTELKTDPDLRDIPVVMLTGSEDAEDVNFAFDAGARGYLVKPLTTDRVLVPLEA